MTVAIRIAIAALFLCAAACTPEGEPMPIGGRTVEIHAGPIDVSEADPRRASILDSLRRTLEDDLDQPLRLEYVTVRERGGWAFATVYPRTPAGAQIDWMRTHYADERRSGLLEDDAAYALLQKRGDAWKVREFSIGSPDNAWMDWGREHGAPKEIFWVAGG
jgi:hypothetical protein